MHRFFVSPDCLSSSDTVSLTDPALTHQLSRVLRLGPGSQIVLLDGTGAEYLVELESFERSVISGRICSTHQSSAEPIQFLTLYQALPKQPAKLEEILQHGTEIGISRFRFMLTERVEVAAVRNIERLQRIVREAAEQSERGIVPQIEPTPLLWSRIFAEPPAGANLVADSYTAEPLLRELLPQLRLQQQLNIFVGPEGGLSQAEIELARSAGAINFSLGPRILRTETAGVAIASALLFG